MHLQLEDFPKDDSSHHCAILRRKAFEKSGFLDVIKFFYRPILKVLDI